MKQLIILFAFVFLSIRAHDWMIQPQSRQNMFSSVAPCGNMKTVAGPIASYFVGDVIEIRWLGSVGHYGKVRISLVPAQGVPSENMLSQNVLYSPDGSDWHEYSTRNTLVVIPDTFGLKTLQWYWVDDILNEKFYSCSDVQIFQNITLLSCQTQCKEVCGVNIVKTCNCTGSIFHEAVCDIEKSYASLATAPLFIVILLIICIL